MQVQLARMELMGKRGKLDELELPVVKAIQATRDQMATQEMLGKLDH